MSIFHVFFLALIQGATEFLPVSSSAHLVLYNKFVIGLQDNLSLDISMHIGSLMAVVLFLVKPLKENTNGFLVKNGLKRSILLLFLATLPLMSMGFFLQYARLVDFSRQLEIIAFTNIIFAFLLLLSDRKKSRRELSNTSARDVFIIGIWQSFAVFPGTSRSGASITGARFLGYNRKDSIIISVILGIPSITISSSYIALKFINSQSKIDFDLAIYATLLSFIFSYLALKFFVTLGEAFSFTPYVIYRIFLGITLLTILYI